MSNVQRQRDDVQLIVDAITATADLWCVPERLRMRAADATTLDEIRIEDGEVRGMWTVHESRLR